MIKKGEKRKNYGAFYSLDLSESIDALAKTIKCKDINEHEKRVILRLREVLKNMLIELGE